MKDWIKNRALRESALLLFLAIFLGFFSTALRNDGFFAPKNAPAASAHVVAPEVIGFHTADSLFKTRKAFFVDSRRRFDFELGHISGAINVPHNDFDESVWMLKNFPKDNVIVVYCDGEECNSSIEVAAKLAQLGFSNVKIFYNGWNEWKMKNGAREP